MKTPIRTTVEKTLERIAKEFTSPSETHTALRAVAIYQEEQIKADQEYCAQLEQAMNLRLEKRIEDARDVVEEKGRD